MANDFVNYRYAATRKVPILPLIVERKYRPDGWLGFLVGGLLYVNLLKGEEGNQLRLEESFQLAANQIGAHFSGNPLPLSKPMHDPMGKQTQKTIKEMNVAGKGGNSNEGNHVQ